MIKERFILGSFFLFLGVMVYFIAADWNMVNTFSSGGLIVGLIVAGIAYIIFSFETSEYLKKIEDKKK